MNTLISTSADRGIGVKSILYQFGLFLGSESKGPPPGVLRCCSTISRCLSITFWSDFSRQSLPEMMSLLMIWGSFSNRAASYSFLADSRIRSLRGFAPGRVVREGLGGQLRQLHAVPPYSAVRFAPRSFRRAQNLPEGNPVVVRPREEPREAEDVPVERQRLPPRRRDALFWRSRRVRLLGQVSVQKLVDLVAGGRRATQSPRRRPGGSQGNRGQPLPHAPYGRPSAPHDTLAFAAGRGLSSWSVDARQRKIANRGGHLQDCHLCQRGGVQS